MESNVNYTIVGIFVITLLTFIILGIIWLSSGISIKHYKIYKVYMTESVNGLNLDAPVVYNGVSVGTVKSIEIDYQHPERVVLLLNVKKGTPVTIGTRAKLDVRSIISGIASINLQDKGTDLTPLRVQKGENYPVISTTPSLFVRIDAMITKFGENFNEVSQSIQALLSKENIRLMQQTLSAGQKAMHAGENTMRMIERQIIPDANRAIRNFDTMSRNFSTLSTEIERNPAVILRGKKQAALGPGEK